MKKRSIFNKEGAAKIVKKQTERFLFNPRKILNNGKMFISKKNNPDDEQEFSFLLTKNNLYYLSGDLSRENDMIVVNSLARIELQWTHTQFYTKKDTGNDTSCLTEKSEISRNDHPKTKERIKYFFDVIKNNKTVVFRVEKKLEYEKWKSLITSLTIQNDFFKQFKVMSSLGLGSAAEVYKIQSRNSSEFFACKRFKKSELTFYTYNILVNEINVLKRVQGHPNVIKLYGIFESENSVYLILELCEGGRVTKKGRKYKSFEMVSLTKTIIDILIYFKRLNIIHRDLKPDNILLKYNNVPLSENKIRIVDFGISVQNPDRVINERIEGTLGYMPPESLFNGYAPSFNFDIFSLGVILYNAITGLKLFGDTDRKIMMNNNKLCRIDFQNYHFQAIDKERSLKS